jgi:hypothetical protein
MSKTELNIAMAGAFLSGLALAFDERLGSVAPVPVWLLIGGVTVLVVGALMLVRRQNKDDRGRF